MASSDLVTVLADGSFEDQIVECSAFLSRSHPEASRSEFIANFQKKAAEAEPQPTEEGAQAAADPVKKQEVVKSLVAEVKSLGEGSDREMEGVFNLISSLVLSTFATPEDEGARQSLLSQLASALVSEGPTEKNLVRYRILSNIFNTLPARSALRLDLFNALLSLASKNDDLDFLASALASLPQWLAEWQVSDEAKSACLEKVAKALESAEKEHDQGSKAYQYLVLHLRFISLNRSASADAKGAAERTVASALRLNKMYEFEDLMKIQAVLDLNGSPVFELLKIFVGGSAEDFDAWLGKGGKQELERLGLSEAELSRKIRLLDLAGLCARSVSTEVAYSEIAKTLKVSEDDVETWVIDVIRAGLVSGKLSQVSSSFRVYRSAHRTFGQEQWQALETRLVQWQSSINNILETIGRTRGGQTAGISGADAAAAQAEASA
ncbi:uncharacterized protein PFL1_04245 [Pseudozyma flocculosa PF-1]|uniref:Eukaryotic translation initiation factor 3 subunit M n=2 Tax=Pseudozyma flocculosa TaxID=84751 RepID=A0A5C3ETJ3_9BASI|nr:uncharacterized protein PFL1_04245 [Pseudozyma flocculosa PF-1]EPQ28418.1 hypothetical protein PFL1_04245 [Pseudozyma flocculosa PF-1]SPO35588.1 related to eIF3m -translation initiation factor 3 subunit M [Pseudozyma flocculosa]